MKRPGSSKSFVLSALLALGLIVLARPLMADLQPRPGHDQRPDRERIQTVIIGKFASEMDLSPEQAEKFFPRLRQYQDRVEELQRAERDTRMQLDELSQSPDADRGQLQKLLDERRRLDNDENLAKQQFLGDIDNFLTPQQISRCSVLLDEVPRHVREFMIQKQRERAHEYAPDTRGQDLPNHPQR